MAFNKSSSLNLIQKDIQRGQIDKAIKKLEELIDLEPNDASLHIKIGDLHLRKGRKSEAKESYNKAASIYLKDGFNNRAIATYKMVSRIDPNNLEVNISIAELFEKQGLIGDALQQYKYAATMFDNQNNFSDAIKVLKKILNLDPDNIPAKIKIAEMLFRSDEKNEAYEILKELSVYLKQKKMFAELVKTLSIFLDIAPKDKFILRSIASAYILLGNSEEGLKKIQSAQKLDPKDTGTLLILAETYLMLGKLNDAESIYCDILRNEEKNYRAKFGLSKIFLRRDNIDEAIKELEPYYNNFEENDELDELADFYNDALEKSPKNISILEKMSEIYRYFSNVDKLVDTYEMMAKIHDSNNQTEKVDFLYQKILQLDPSHEKARAYLEKGNYELLGAFDEKAKEVDVEAINEHITEANVYLKYGLYEQAKEHIDYVLKEDPNNYDAHMALKEIYVSKNQKDLAIGKLFYLSELAVAINKDKEAIIAFLNEIIKLDPNNSQAKDRLKNMDYVPSEPEKAPEKTKKTELKAAEPEPYKKIDSFEGIELIIEEPEELKKGAKAEKTLQEELEEAEFYYTEGLYDDAKRIYKKILLEDTYNMIAIERLEQIEQKAQGPVEEQVMHKGREGEQTFDFMKELEESLPEDLLKSDFKSPPLDDKNETQNILSQFKKGLEEQLDSKDYDSHYNLGIAYKEMGLFDDSLDEFKKALAVDSSKVLECCTMLGTVSLEQKNFPEAIKYFETILEKLDLPEDQDINLRYELAVAYSENGQLDDALNSFNYIFKIDPNFRDIKKRIKMLSEAGSEEIEDKKIVKKSKISYV